MVVSGSNVIIYDPKQNTSHREAEKLISYLYEEGFIGNWARYSIIRDPD